MLESSDGQLVAQDVDDLTIDGDVGVHPVADAGGPYAGIVNVPVTLAGTATDPDGDPFSNAWGSVGPGTCTFSDRGSLTSTITCDTVGDYTLQLTSTDGTGGGVDFAKLTIAATAPLPKTGPDSASYAAAGLVLIVIGAAVLTIERRRRTKMAK
jgi:LPXTG-motif cell wall-anchored protein